MRWVKQPYFAKANTHRAGWKFWDLEASDKTSLAFVRYIPDRGYTTHCQDNDDWHAIEGCGFPTLKEAQDHCVAHFVLKKLEDTND